MEEDFWPKEAFVAHVDVEGGLRDGVDSSVLFDPLPRISVILSELLHNVGTDVTVSLLEIKAQVSGRGKPRG